MGEGHWVLRYCGKINFWFCGILWTSAMQFFSIVDGIKDHPPNPPPFLSFFQFPFVSETDWKWKALDLTFMNKFLIVISMLFALNVTYRVVVSTWHQVSTRYWSIMVSGEFRCNIAVCVIFFLFFAVLWCLDPPPPSDVPLLWQPCSHLFPFSWPYYSPLMFLLLEMRIRKQEKHLFELQSWRIQRNSLLSIG